MIPHPPGHLRPLLRPTWGDVAVLCALLGVVWVLGCAGLAVL